MMKIISVLAVIYALSLPQASGAADTRFLQGLGDNSYHHVESAAVGRSFHTYVMVPFGYDESGARKYPTVYLLDGGGLFPMMTAYYRYLNFGEEIPDAIIVGISYGGDTVEEGNFRSTDYTAPSAEREYWGGAQAFQKFLGDELLPFIESRYASDAEKRIVFGQSIGGQFVLYTALTQPDLFWGHIASNPALHRNLQFFLQQHGEPNPDTGRSRLFVGSGTLDDPLFRQPAQAWIAHWSAVQNKPWDFRAVSLEGHTHMSAPPASFRQGMHWLFSEH
jgi:predicted alpha/beta superfamily hydrolase